MKNTGFKITFTIYIVMFLADIIITLMNDWKVLEHLETNPLYRLTGSFLPIILLNFLLLIIIWYAYNSDRFTNLTRFFIIGLMASIIMMRFFAIQNAITLYDNPITIEQAKLIGTTEAKNHSLITLIIDNYKFLIFSIIIFFLFNLDHEVKRKWKKKKKYEK